MKMPLNQVSSGLRPSNTKMGPKKKSDHKPEKCQYFDRGFCKKGSECSKVHPGKVCEDPTCFDDNCKSKFNRRNICLYSHVIFASDDGKFNILENELSKRIAKLENWKIGKLLEGSTG